MENTLIATKNWYHFSVDDIFEELLSASDCKQPLFENQVFAFFKELHDTYDAHISLYLFYEKNIDGQVRSLREIQTFREELATVDWLHFAPHARNFERMPFDQSIEELKDTCTLIFNEIKRITGQDHFASIVRLHFYSEMYELANYFKKYGVVALYSTDKPDLAYRLPDSCKEELFFKGITSFSGMFFLRTQFRVENLTGERLDNVKVKERLKINYDKYGYITIYSHEYELRRSEVRNMVRQCFSIFKEMKLISLR